nr:Chain UD, UnkD [Trypanosoma brucei brucei]
AAAAFVLFMAAAA